MKARATARQSTIAGERPSKIPGLARSTAVWSMLFATPVRACRSISRRAVLVKDRGARARPVNGARAQPWAWDLRIARGSRGGAMPGRRGLTRDTSVASRPSNSRQEPGWNPAIHFADTRNCFSLTIGVPADETPRAGADPPPRNVARKPDRGRCGPLDICEGWSANLPGLRHYVQYSDESEDFRS